MEFFANQIQPPASPIDQFSKLAALQAMGQEKELRQKQIQGADIANQQNQAALDSEKGMMQAYKEANGDLTKAAEIAPKYNVLPGDIIKLKSAGIKQQSDALDLVAKQGTEAARQADLMVGAHDAIDKAPADQKPVIYQQQLASLQKQGVDVSQLPQQYPGDDQFKMLGIVARAHSKNVDDALKASEQSKNTAQAASATAQAAKTNAEISPTNPADPNIAKQKYQGILQQIQQGGIKSLSPTDYQWARAYEASQAKTTTQADSLGVTSTNTSKPSGLATVGGRGVAPVSGATPTASGGTPTNSTLGSLIDAFGQYKADPAMLNRMMYKHPGIIGQILQKYPDFDQTSYVAKNKLIQGYTSGSQSKEINAINTAMGHVKVLDDAIDAVNNGDVTTLNKIGNAIGVNVTGKTAAAALQLIVHRVGPEIANAYIPGGGGVNERIADEKDFDVNLPPQTLHNNAAITVKMLRSKVGALENQYKNTVGRDDFTQKFITPEAQASFQKFSQQGGAQGGNVAPEGTIVQTPKGRMIKRGGQWVAY